jgi:hypothetical protein
MKTRLFLHSDNDQSIFTLTMEGAAWRRTFNQLAAALDYAAETVTEETPLLVFNEIGRVMIQSVVSPRAQAN